MVTYDCRARIIVSASSFDLQVKASEPFSASSSSSETEHSHVARLASMAGNLVTQTESVGKGHPPPAQYQTTVHQYPSSSPLTAISTLSTSLYRSVPRLFPTSTKPTSAQSLPQRKSNHRVPLTLTHRTHPSLSPPVFINPPLQCRILAHTPT